MRAKRRLAATAAALGVTCLALIAIPSAGAQTTTLGIYDSTGLGSGIKFTAAIQPSLFDPLVEGGFALSRTSITSQGQGLADSLAAQVFPGQLATGALGCEFRASGGESEEFDNISSAAQRSLWVGAKHPPGAGCKAEDEATLTPTSSTLLGGFGFPNLEEAGLSQVTDHVSARQGDHRAEARLGQAKAMVRTSGLALRPDPAQPPVVSVGSVVSESQNVWDGAGVGHAARVTMNDVEIAGGMVRIGKLVALAATASDGAAGTPDATFTYADVTVNAGGTQRSATIDNEGVRVTDPALGHKQRLSLSEKINDTLLGAGLEISVGEPTEISEGPTAEAAISGLVLTIRGKIPELPPLPSAGPVNPASVIGPILSQIPTRCLSEFDPSLPGLCFGSGLIPSGGNVVTATIALGNASSLTGGSPTPVFEAGCPECPGGTGVGGSQFIAGTPGTPGVPGTPPQTIGGNGGAGGAGGAGPTNLVGLVARMPSALLAALGGVFLLLAVGMQMRPSLEA